MENDKTRVDERKNEDKIRKRNIIIAILIIIILLLLCFLGIKLFGDSKGDGERTGNIDVYEIKCLCDECGEGEEKTDSDEQSESGSGNSGKKVDEGLIVYDNEKVWDNQRLNIFDNPAYSGDKKIAPGSHNSYTFKIKNKNSFAVTVDIEFIEENAHNINMLFKLKNDGNYLVGSEASYAEIAGKHISQITLTAGGEKTYDLDWKWVDSDNDTVVGFDARSQYGLTIKVGAEQL